MNDLITRTIRAIEVAVEVTLLLHHSEHLQPERAGPVMGGQRSSVVELPEGDIHPRELVGGVILELLVMTTGGALPLHKKRSRHRMLGATSGNLTVQVRRSNYKNSRTFVVFVLCFMLLFLYFLCCFFFCFLEQNF